MWSLDINFAKELNPVQKRMWNVIVFLIRLSVLSLPLYVILSFTAVLLPLQVLIASQTGWVLQLMGFSVTQNTALVSVSGPASQQVFNFLVDADCTAWKSMLFAFALIFAVPRVKNRKRLYGLALAVPVIWVVNLSRIVGSVMVEQSYGLETAMFVHDVLWQFGLIALVLVVWGVWMNRFALKKK